MSRTPLPPADFAPSFDKYTGQGAFRFWCQTVLPLVYDDSLSYYELLNKVVHYLNNTISDVKTTEDNLQDLLDSFINLQKYVNDYFYSSEQIIPIIDKWLTDHPEATTTVQDNSLTNKKLNAELQKQIFGGLFYNVNDYGIYGDTEDDLYEQFYDFFHEINSPNKKVVYLPAGLYNISDTLFIPENTIFTGEGKDTIVYFTGEYGHIGAGLSNGGDNVTICNMMVNHKNTDGLKTRAKSALGGIGFSTFDFSSWNMYHQEQNFTRHEKTNLKAINLYSDCTYLLQTEPNNLCGISDVLYKNIYAPDSLVSVFSHDGDGFIKNMEIDNVHCAVFRCGAGYRNSHDIYVSNLICCEIYSPDPCNFNKFTVDDTINTEWKWYNYHVIVGGNSSYKNGKINTTRFGYTFGNYSAEPYLEAGILLNTVKISGDVNLWSNAVTGASDVKLRVFNCDFLNKSISNVLKYITDNSNVSFTQSNNGINLSYLKARNYTTTLLHPNNPYWSQDSFPTYVQMINSTVHVWFALVLNDYINPIFSVPDYMAREHVLVNATLINLEGTEITSTSNCLLASDVNGNFTLQRPEIFKPQNFNRIIGNFSYSL